MDFDLSALLDTLRPHWETLRALNLRGGLYYYVLAGGLLLFLLGWVMIFFAGLRRGLMTGLLALFPGLNLIFVGRNWTAGGVRNGFLASIVGILLAGVGFYGGGERELTQKLETAGVQTPEINVPIRRPVDTEVPNQAEAEAAGVDTTTSVLDEPELDPAFRVKPLPPEGSLQLEQVEVRRAYQPTCPELLGEDVGLPVRLMLSNGQRPEGTLQAADDRAAIVSRKLTGGEAAFTYLFTDIQSIEVFAPLVSGATRMQRCQALAVEQEAAREELPPPPVVTQ
jgi:hypothetical protein